MTAPDPVNLSALINDARCFALVRQHRWPEGVRCPACGGATVVRDGRDETQPQRQRYRCKACSDRKSTRLNSSHANISYAVFCLKKKKYTKQSWHPCLSSPNLNAI